MSYLNAAGNLAGTPELREGEHGPYAYARVIVNDRVRDTDGAWTDGPATAYDLAVTGTQAQNLVDTAQESGNVRVIFAGELTRHAWDNGQTSGVNNRVRVDDLGVSLRGNITVSVTRRTSTQDRTATGEPTPAQLREISHPTAASDAQQQPATPTPHPTGAAHRPATDLGR